MKSKQSRGRPKRLDKDNENAPSAERGTIPGDKRKTYIVNAAIADKIDGIAFWDRLTAKEVVNTAFKNFIAQWEKNNGPVKPTGKKINHVNYMNKKIDSKTDKSLQRLSFILTDTDMAFQAGKITKQVRDEMCKQISKITPKLKSKKAADILSQAKMIRALEKQLLESINKSEKNK